MTRLQKYILNEKTQSIFSIYTEDSLNDAIDLIKKDCKPYLKLIKTPKRMAVRDEKRLQFFSKGYVRKDRRPKDTNIEVHEKLDKLFLEKFEWRARSNSVFTWIISGVMKPLFFPIGKFDYIWSPNVYDLYTDVHPEMGYDELDDIVNTYHLNDGYHKVGNQEVMWRCKSYYLLDLRWTDIIATTKKRFFASTKERLFEK